MAGRVSRYGANVRAVDHDDDFLLVALPTNVQGRRQGSRFSCLNDTRNTVQAVAHASVIGRGAWQEHREQPGCLAKRIPRAKLGLQVPQLCRAAVRQQTGERRKRHVDHAHAERVGAYANARRSDGHGAEQRLEPAGAPVA